MAPANSALDSLHAWLSSAFATIGPIVTGLLAGREFWAGLVATLIGVVAAFELERWRDRRHAREQYARHLSAVRYESAQLHAICEGALAGLAQGAITNYEIDSPALRGLVSGPELQEHASHGLAMVLISLLAVAGRTRNGVDYYRRLLVSGAGASIALPAAQIARLTKHLTRLQDGIEIVQGVLDEELKRLRRGVKETAEDKAVIDAFREATK